MDRIMRIVTSFAPNNYYRQRLCLNTWLRLGLEVTAVQAKHEIDITRMAYPEVTFIESDYPIPIIKELTQLAASSSPILLINSDIEIIGDSFDFFDTISYVDNTLVMGVRWNYEDGSYPEYNKYGIDAFVITHKINKLIAHDPMFIMGKPTWDYWIPLLCLKEHMILDTIKHPFFFHHAHPKNWDQVTHAYHMKHLCKITGLPQQTITKTILKITGRE